jgi:hypothetical protein
MPLPAHAQDWMERAEIDYIGPFVKAWAAFNAWYRHASGAEQERAMLNWVKTQPNAVRRGILALLEEKNTTSEAQGLKLAIADMQTRLDAIHFETNRKGMIERISLRSVCISQKDFKPEQIERNGHRFRAAKIKGGDIEITVTTIKTSTVKFQHAQPLYDPTTVYALPAFTDNLSEPQRTTLRQFYDGCNPRPMRDLLHGPASPLPVSTMEFRCTCEELLAGLIETIYAMRNALLHGEVEPDPTVLSCYEAAYRIVMKFLACIR